MEFSTLNEQKLRIKTEWFVLNREEPKIGLALVDNMPSPYDQEGLRFKRGDRIQILCMNPSGLWRGRLLAPKEAKEAVIEARRRRLSTTPLSGSVYSSTRLLATRGGHDIPPVVPAAGGVRTEGVFKFIHVRIMEEIENMYDSIQLNQKISLESVLMASNLSFLHPILTLNGFDNIAELVKISKDDLAYLGIAVSHQDKLFNSLRSMIVMNCNIADVEDIGSPDSNVDTNIETKDDDGTTVTSSADSCLSESMSDLSLSSGILFLPL